MKYIDALDETEVDVDGVIDFTLGNKQIQELIKKLLEVQDSQESVEFEVDAITKMIIHHPNDPLLKIKKEEKENSSKLGRVKEEK
jgi:hypothetical protein